MFIVIPTATTTEHTKKFKRTLKWNTKNIQTMQKKKMKNRETNNNKDNEAQTES